MTFTDHELEYFQSQRLGRLATVDRAGRPQNNPVGFHPNDDGTVDIYGRAMAETRKWRNIAANPNVSLVIDDLASVDPWTVRGVEIRGTAEPITIDVEPGGYMRPEAIRIHPTKIISWGVNPPDSGVGGSRTV
jgi:pyridoxamine 5'-phosphate oxidase family protein